MGFRTKHMVLPESPLRLGGAAMIRDDEKIVAIQLCPACKQYTARKDYLTGGYKCPCG